MAVVLKGHFATYFTDRHLDYFQRMHNRVNASGLHWWWLRKLTATSHWPNQCWPSFISSWGVTRSQWVIYLTNNISAAKHCCVYTTYHAPKERVNLPGFCHGTCVFNGQFDKLPCYVQLIHDDDIKWKYVPRYWSFVAGNSPVTGEFPAQSPVMCSFDAFFDLHLNKRLSEQSWGWWFETPLC